MSTRRDSLSIPDRKGTEDPGARDLDSDSEDHFSDAQSIPVQSSRASPIPRTRVEKVSDEPSYGEVPGTEAYKLREGDAEPDEIAILPDATKSSSESAVQPSPDRPTTPGGRPIPTTVVEESEDGAGAKTPDTMKHHSDPLPDLVVKADGTVEVEPADASISSSDANTSSPTQRSPNEPRSAGTPAEADDEEDSGGEDKDEEDGDDFGDDFDDFEEGGEADGDDDDFGDFDDGFQEPDLENSTTSTIASEAAPRSAQPQQSQQQPAGLPFPIPDFGGLDAEEILRATTPYLNGIYRPEDDPALSSRPPPQLSNSLFLTPRSASLWSQLVAPPPLAPPDWIRSRIRRLFLVSLGVPVDLDEILPASKQKKLVLPSLSVLSNRDSPRTSTDSRSRENGGTSAANNSIARLKQSGANASNSSVDSQGRTKDSSGSSRKRKGPPPAPDLDLVSAQQLATTTDEALDGMTDEELAAHVEKLKVLETTAKEVLDYWTKRTDEKIGDREAFEGVIENLVKHARKTRK